MRIFLLNYRELSSCETIQRTLDWAKNEVKDQSSGIPAEKDETTSTGGSSIAVRLQLEKRCDEALAQGGSGRRARRLGAARQDGRLQVARRRHPHARESAARARLSFFQRAGRHRALVH